MRQIDRDAKTTGLKEIQGLIWREGFEAGKLRTHIYPDVPVAMRNWTDAGRDVRIYSSGSVLAQKMFFANTDVGSLSGFLSGHYDTTIGSKRDNASYVALAADWGLPPAEIIFLSDIVAELDAARTAGLHTALLTRPENPPVADRHDHPAIASFGVIEVV